MPLASYGTSIASIELPPLRQWQHLQSARTQLLIDVHADA